MVALKDFVDGFVVGDKVILILRLVLVHESEMIAEAVKDVFLQFCRMLVRSQRMMGRPGIWPCS